MKMFRRILALALALLLLCSAPALAGSFSFETLQQSPFYDGVLLDILNEWGYLFELDVFSFTAYGNPEDGSMLNPPSFYAKEGDVQASRIDFILNGITYACESTDGINFFYLSTTLEPLLQAMLQAEEATILIHFGESHIVTYELPADQYADGLRAFVQGLYDLGLVEIALNDPLSGFLGAQMTLTITEE